MEHTGGGSGKNISGNGDINVYEEIGPELMARRQDSRKYETMPALNKNGHNSKELPSSNHDQDDSKDRQKKGFSGKLAKKMTKVKHKVTRRVSEQECPIETVLETHGTHNLLYRSKSSDDLIWSETSYPVTAILDKAPPTDSDDTVNTETGTVYDDPKPKPPDLPARKARRGNGVYVNTMLVRATVSPMIARKNGRTTIADSDGPYSPMQTEDNSYSSIGFGKDNSSRRMNNSSTERKQKAAAPTDTDLNADKLGDLETDTYVEMVGKPANTTDHKIEVINKPNDALRGTSDESITKASGVIDTPKSNMADIRTLTIADVGKKLDELKLGSYVDMFRENQVDGMILANLKTEDFVNELGMKKLEAVRLCMFVESGHIPK